MTRLERIRAKIERLQEIEERLSWEEYNRHPHKQDLFSRDLRAGPPILDMKKEGDVDVEIIQGGKS